MLNILIAKRVWQLQNWNHSHSAKETYLINLFFPSIIVTKKITNFLRMWSLRSLPPINQQHLNGMGITFVQDCISSVVESGMGAIVAAYCDTERRKYQVN